MLATQPPSRNECEAIDLYRNHLDGLAIVAGHPEYESARQVFNRMHDCHPLAIVRSMEPNSLATALRIATDYGLPIAIRGGGHHVAGFGTVDRGLVIDFSPFRAVSLAPDGSTARAEPGARLVDVDSFLCPRGRVVPVGTVSQTGVAGLALSGGIGWLVGSLGYTCNCIVGADVMLAHGEVIQAEDPQHCDLLWALRGGGGNFGVVLEFRLRTFPMPPVRCRSGVVAWKAAPSVLSRLFDFLDQDCPRTMTCAAILQHSAAGRFLQIDYCSSSGCASDVERLERHLSTDISWATPVEDFIAWQQYFDRHFEPPMRGAWKSSYTPSLPRDEILTLYDALGHSPGPGCSILIEHLHGPSGPNDTSHSAFPLRNMKCGALIAGRWPHPEMDKRYMDWVYGTFQSLDPAGRRHRYANYESGDLRGANLFQADDRTRLRDVKRKYDPRNIFCRNHNISEGGAS
jgi:hypothetical protein